MVYFAFRVVNFFHTNLEFVVVVGLKSHPFARFTPSNCPRIEGFTFDTGGISNNNFEIYRKFCPAIGNN
jgi:hypothetical protein